MRWNEEDREAKIARQKIARQKIASTARSYRGGVRLYSASKIASTARSYRGGVRLQWWQSLNDLNGFEADGDDAGDEVYDVARFIGTVRVVDDATPPIYLDTILIYHPL